MTRPAKSGKDQSQLPSPFCFSSALAVGCLFTFLALAPQSQAQVSAAISGRVTDQSGAAVSGATITAKNLETEAVRTATTDEAGRSSLFPLTHGDYEKRTGEHNIQPT